MTEPTQPPAPSTKAFADHFDPSRPPPAIILSAITGAFLLARNIYLVAELGIPDLLVQGPRSVEDLAAATKTHADSLYRTLRPLPVMGMFAVEPDGRFRNTPLSEVLRSDVPMSMRSYARYFGSPWVWALYADILDTVKTGKPLHELRGEGNLFEVLGKNPELGRLFNEAMTNLGPLGNFALLKSYDFAGIDSLVDVAGGQGLLLSQILKTHPRIKGTLFDQPQVIEHARKLGALAELEKEGRAELVGGSMFESIPSGRDAYLFKQIFHNWGDAEVKKFLTVARTAAGGPGKKLLVLELVVNPNPNEGLAPKLGDLLMMAQFSGRERTPQEFSALFEATGFKLNRVVPTPTDYAIVEGVSV